MSLSQKASVFAAVSSVMNATSFDSEVKPTSEQRKQIIELVAKDLFEGRAEFSDEAKLKYDTFEKVRGYTGGMVSNWLRKDTRLNGNVKHEIKNPGSRAGQGDEVLKNLKALRTQLTDVDHLAAVDEKIAEREQEIAQAKAKTVTIDISKIPEELRYLIPTAS